MAAGLLIVALVLAVCTVIVLYSVKKDIKEQESDLFVATDDFQVKTYAIKSKKGKK